VLAAEVTKAVDFGLTFELEVAILAVYFSIGSFASELLQLLALISGLRACRAA
jgi:hypothetical protein